jgi:hypothetical protein
LVAPLQQLTGLPVHFVGDCVGPVAEAGLAATPAGAIALDGEPAISSRSATSQQDLRHPAERRSATTFRAGRNARKRIRLDPGTGETAARTNHQLSPLQPDRRSKMARITLRQLLDHAAEHGYGVPAFNINNMEQGLAIMEAAKACNAPVIMQASRGARSYAGDIMLAEDDRRADRDVSRTSRSACTRITATTKPPA